MRNTVRKIADTGTKPIAQPFPKRLGDPPQLWDDQYISFRIVRSLKLDEKALERDGREVWCMNAMPLIREDLLPFMDSFNISFGAGYYTDDRYYLSAKYLFPDEERAEPEKMAAELRAKFAAARAGGVQGSYHVMNVRFGKDFHAAESFSTPSGLVEAGAILEDHLPGEVAGMINWMDAHDRSQAHVSDGFVNEAFRQFDQETEAGKAMRYGMLLGMQALRDQMSGRAGAADADRMRAQLLMDLRIEVRDEDLPSPR